MNGKRVILRRPESTCQRMLLHVSNAVGARSCTLCPVDASRAWLASLARALRSAVRIRIATARICIVAARMPTEGNGRHQKQRTPPQAMAVAKSNGRHQKQRTPPITMHATRSNGRHKKQKSLPKATDATRSKKTFQNGTQIMQN